MLIEWDESLSMGINEIDAQHKHLVNLINQLNYSLEIGQAKDMVQTALSGMVDYTIIHFLTEENYFNKFGFENAEEHKKAHKTFIDKVEEFKKDVELQDTNFDESNVYIAKEMVNFLKDWIINHIKVIDKKYVNCFKIHGVN